MPILAALLALTPLQAGSGLPRVSDIQAVLDRIEKCRGLEGPECPPPQRIYKVHSARCVAIAPDAGRPAVNCRLDMTVTDTVPQLTATRFRDGCLSFARGADGIWTGLGAHDGPCAAPSMLRRDPHARPTRAEMRAALLGLFACHWDEEGITDCFYQPDSTAIRSVRCRPIAPGEHGIRVACRVDGSAGYSFPRGRNTPFTNLCVHFERYTDPGESPPYWSAGHVVGRCEID